MIENSRCRNRSKPVAVHRLEGTHQPSRYDRLAIEIKAPWVANCPHWGITRRCGRSKPAADVVESGRDALEVYWYSLVRRLSNVLQLRLSPVCPRKRASGAADRAAASVDPRLHGERRERDPRAIRLVPCLTRAEYMLTRPIEHRLVGPPDHCRQSRNLYVTISQLP